MALTSHRKNYGGLWRHLPRSALPQRSTCRPQIKRAEPDIESTNLTSHTSPHTRNSLLTGNKELASNNVKGENVIFKIENKLRRELMVCRALVAVSLNPLLFLFVKIPKCDLLQLLVNSYLALDPFVQVVLSVGKIFNGVSSV
jgi:hypothetical protein